MCETARVDLKTDPQHCGSCNDNCQIVDAGASCRMGQGVLDRGGGGHSLRAQVERPTDLLATIAVAVNSIAVDDRYVYVAESTSAFSVTTGLAQIERVARADGSPSVVVSSCPLGASAGMSFVTVDSEGIYFICLEPNLGYPYAYSQSWDGSCMASLGFASALAVSGPWAYAFTGPKFNFTSSLGSCRVCRLPKPPLRVHRISATQMLRGRDSFM